MLPPSLIRRSTSPRRSSPQRAPSPMPDQDKTAPVAGHHHNARVVVLDASIDPDVNDKVGIGPEGMMGGRRRHWDPTVPGLRTSSRSWSTGFRGGADRLRASTPGAVRGSRWASATASEARGPNKRGVGPLGSRTGAGRDQAAPPGHRSVRRGPRRACRVPRGGLIRLPSRRRW